MESRILIRTTRYKINEKIAIDKKTKTCNNELIQIKIEEGINLSVHCSALAFEEVIGKLEKILETNCTTNRTETKDRTGKIVTEVLRIVRKESSRNEAIFAIKSIEQKVVF